MDAQELLVIILYLGLIVLITVSIVLCIKLMGTLGKVNKVVDDVEEKVGKLDGLFDIIDSTTDVISSFSDRIVAGVTKGLSKLFNKREGRGEDE